MRQSSIKPSDNPIPKILFKNTQKLRLPIAPVPLNLNLNNSKSPKKKKSTKPAAPRKVTVRILNHQSSIFKIFHNCRQT